MTFVELDHEKNLLGHDKIKLKKVTLGKLTKMLRLLHQIYLLILVFFSHSLVQQGAAGQQGLAGIVGIKGDKVEPNTLFQIL